MIRSARAFATLLFALTLIAAGAETKKKSTSSAREKSTPKPTAAAKQTPSASSASKRKSTSKAPSSASTRKKPATPAKDEGETPALDTSTSAKPGKEESTSKAQAASTPSAKRSSNKAKASPAPTEPESTESEPTDGARGMLGPTVATIAPENLAELHQQPEWVQQLIRDALILTTQNLGYLFGSSDPKAGGMDCSGAIYHILQSHGFKDVPRDSRGQYAWLADKATLRTVPNQHMADFDFRALRPGDLLFWTGTYQVVNNGAGLPISHVMLFLGIERDTGKPVMWGASDGRTYAGKQRYGVSVFDFKLPRLESKSRFVGFGQLPAPAKR